ncbi:MAG: hypothetical protein HY902_12330, partial [Deltaproteobacteria bacterium]|nr:hypothetical protein [Deltaproteobacteria bacterium]
MKALVFVLLLGLGSLTACGADPGAGSADTGTTIVDADANGMGADTASDDVQDSAPLDQQATLADVKQFTEVDEPDGALSADSDAAADGAPDWNGTAANWPLDAGPNQGCLPGEFKAGPVCQAATCDSVGAYETAQPMALVYDHQTCTVDADCAIVDMSTRCYPKCPYGVQKEFAAAAQAFADEFDAAVCIPFDVSEVCKTKDIILKCSPPSPGCVKGYCAADKQYETNDCL